MILYHVPQSAIGIIVIPAAGYPYIFSHSYLNMINIIVIPDRFINNIGKPECHQVLDSFFAEIMINAIDLLFRQNLHQVLVELLR